MTASLAIAVIVAGCASTTPSPMPSPPPASTASPSPTPGATTTATPAATPTSPPATATPTPSPAAACAVEPQDGRLPSDRLTDVVITEGDDADLVTFVFGASSIGSPAGTPQGTLEAIEPPYTEAASGLEIEMRGEHVIQVRFEHMSLANDVGQPVYDGELAFRPDLPALTDVVNYDMSEGIVGWLVGWDGPGCVTLATEGRTVTVAIDHPAG